MIRRLSFLLVLFVFVFVVSFTKAKDIPGFWSLDCGGTGFEEPNNITWVPDEGFVRTGVSRNGNYGTLRAFPSKKMKKNCYTILVGKRVKIYVRLYFSYGNYDELYSPPEMDLIFDGSNFGTFNTTRTGGRAIEVIYVTKRANTSICFGRTTSDKDPFASFIKVRTLKTTMYKGVDENKALLLEKRTAFGVDKVIMYPDDPYDRHWYPRSDGFTVLRSDTNYTNTTSWRTGNIPPELLTRAAVGPLNGSSRLSLTFSPYLPTSWSNDIYYCTYFSEMSNKTAYGARAFHLFRDGVQRTFAGQPIVPPYQSVLGIEESGVYSSNSTLTFEFVSAYDATLPPIISAIEVHRVSEARDVTSENDVMALGILQERFEVLQEWTGDPCLPMSYNWEWVGCHHRNTISRVTKLNLSGFRLSSKIPDFSKLDQLVVIDLHNNSFTGPVPEFFNNFQNLTVLNLADNNFTSIPTSLRNNKRIKLNVCGNPIRNLPPRPPNPR